MNTALRTNLAALYKNTRNSFYKPNANATLLLGLDKSGTSVTINLLAQRAGISFIDDPMYKIGGFDVVLQGETTLHQYLNKYSYTFSKKLIRYPIEPEAVRLAAGFFKMEKYFVTIRNPVDNIKSILSRLNLRGDLNEIDISSLDVHSDWIKMLSRQNNYIESLAQCWVDAYSQNALLDKENCILFKYEDFISDKSGYITEKVRQAGYHPKKSIDHLIDIQYQPKGTKVSNKEFFGPANLNKIKKTTGNLASKFGYDL